MIVYRSPSAPVDGHSLLEAWHVVTTIDAFLDSDEEDIDESARYAYGTPSPSMIPGPVRTCLLSFSAMRLQVLAAQYHC
jgi:hypothetical protein